MKPSDVTSVTDIAKEIIAGRDVYFHAQRIAALIVKSSEENNEPITAEWLESNGYWREETYSEKFCHRDERRLRVLFCGEGMHVLYYDNKIPTKTIGQLRALRAGLGIGEVQS